MVNDFRVVVLAVFCFAIVIGPGMGLRCWSCESSKNPDCKDPMNITDHTRSFLIKDCREQLGSNTYTFGEMICKKIIQRAHGGHTVIRKCAIPTAEERTDGVCHITPNSYTTIESCHVCTTDLCNAAPGSSTAINRLIYLCSISLLILGISPAGGAVLSSYLPGLSSF